VTEGGAHRSDGSSTRWWNPVRAVVFIIGGLRRWTAVVEKGSCNISVEVGGREGCPKSKRGVKLTEGGDILVEIRRGDDELWRPVCQAVVEKYEGGSSTASTRRKLTWGEEHDDGTRSDFFG
jgi:hypothetical protein